MYLTKRSFSNKVWKRKVFDKLFSSFFCASTIVIVILYQYNIFLKEFEMCCRHIIIMCVCVCVSYTYSPVEK